MNCLMKSVQDNNKMFFRVVAMLLCVVATCFFSACHKDDEIKIVPNGDDVYAPSRTVLVYFVAENNLTYSLNTDANEILEGMKTEGLWEGDRLLLYIDDIDLPRFYMIDRNTTATRLSDLTPVKTYSEEVNSSSPEQLAEALAFMRSKYPANSYGLVMGSHASGWIPSTYPGDYEKKSRPRYSFGIDNGKNSSSGSLNGSQMNIDDMARVIEQSGGVDFIFFDACFMQTVEVAYELRNAAKYIIGSPAEIPGPGAYYQTMVPAMFKATGYEEAMLSAYYDYYTTVRTDYGIVLSCVETAGMDRFASYMKTVIDNHRNDILDANYSSIQNYFRFGSWATHIPDMYDMQGIMKQVLSESEFEQWKEELAQVVTCKHAGQWYSAFNGRLNYIDDEQCSGMAMFVPLSKYDGRTNEYNKTYPETAWGKDVWK